MEIEVSEPQSIIVLKNVFSALRKIDEDLVFFIDKEKVSFSALNSSNSALPTISFKSTFFKSFKYISENKMLIYQVQALLLITAFKNAINPTLLKFSIPDEEVPTLFISLIDKHGINHTWELSISPESQFYSAVFDPDEICAEIKCRYDVFNGLSDAFRGVSTIFMEVSQKGTKGELNIRSKSSDESSSALSSTLKIQKSEKCEIVVNEGTAQVQVTFSLLDFIVGIKIARLISQFLTISVISSGQPIIMKVSTNTIQFSMTLATLSDDIDDESDDNVELTNNSNSHETSDQPGFNINNDVQTNNMNGSQGSTWQDNGTNNLENNKASASFDSSCSSLSDKKPSRISQTFVQGLYTESPPFPTKRKAMGSNVIAQASQPESEDDSITDST